MLLVKNLGFLICIVSFPFLDPDIIIQNELSSFLTTEGLKDGGCSVVQTESIENK